MDYKNMIESTIDYMKSQREVGDAVELVPKDEPPIKFVVTAVNKLKEAVSWKNSVTNVDGYTLDNAVRDISIAFENNVIDCITLSRKA